MFLVRTVFWLSVVIVLLPAGGEEEQPGIEAVGAVEALSAAQTTIDDFSGFCQRNENACKTGSVVLSAFGQKARYGAQIVYEYLDDKFGNEDEVAIEAIDKPTKP